MATQTIFNIIAFVGFFIFSIMVIEFLLSLRTKPIDKTHS